MELNDLLMKTAEVTAAYNDFTFKMKVWTEKMTPAYKVRLIQALLDDAEQQERERRQAEAAEADGEAEASEQSPARRRAPVVKDEFALMLSDLIKEWDVVCGGEPFPPTYENLSQLSFQCLRVLTNEISTFLGALVNPPKGTN